MRKPQTLEEYVQRHLLTSSSLEWNNEHEVDTRAAADKTNMTRSIRIPLSSYDSIDMDHVLHLVFPSEENYIYRKSYDAQQHDDDDDYYAGYRRLETRTERTIQGRIIRLASRGEREDWDLVKEELEEDEALRQIRQMEEREAFLQREAPEQQQRQREARRVTYMETRNHRPVSPILVPDCVPESNVKADTTMEQQQQTKSSPTSVKDHFTYPDPANTECCPNVPDEECCGRQSFDGSDIVSLPQRFQFTKDVSFQSMGRRNDSDELSIKSFTSTYSVESNVSIMKLKARKRQLEKVASQPRMNLQTLSVS